MKMIPPSRTLKKRDKDTHLRRARETEYSNRRRDINSGGQQTAVSAVHTQTTTTTSSGCEENRTTSAASTQTTGTQTQFCDAGSFDLQHGAQYRPADRRDKDGALDRPVGNQGAGESTSTRVPRTRSKNSSTTATTNVGTATTSGSSSRTSTC